MIVFTTLAENDYFYGVAALLNSMVKNGTYGDKIIIGYRGQLPKWLPVLSTSKNGQSFTLNSSLEVELVEVRGDLHMVHEKPEWFRYLTEELEPDADEYFFFDSDIIVINRMGFFGEWVKQGVALCEDVNYDMSVDHPIRKQWENILSQQGFSTENQLSRYYNSGFLGWRKETKEFVNLWDKCSQILGEFSGDMKKFRVNDRTSIVLSTNQDSLNLAAMATALPLSTIGPEAMGFHYGFPLMVHPLGPKPWNRNFLIDFLNGTSPRYADVLFWDLVNSDMLKPFPKYKIVKQKIIVRLCKFLSRFYKRRE